jgi:NAD(P)-dependent dehydrogenase (short-subunit alcohol dehydrogenase family)
MFPMACDLRGSVALVTGASRGIGRSVSIALAEAGAHVVVSARSGGELEAVKAVVEGKGGRATVVPADLSVEADVVSLFREVEKGPGRLDILVNNAGIGLWGKLVDFPADDFDRLYAVNVRGLYLCCQRALRLMIPKKRGFIFNVSSVVGFKGYPKQSAYTATKHAVMGITKSLAVEAQEHGLHRGRAPRPRPLDPDASGRHRGDDPLHSLAFRPGVG